MTNPKHIEFLEQAKAHYAADMLIKGTYGSNGDNFRGCSVGCHLHHIEPASSPNVLVGKHKIVANYYEYPEWLALMQDTIFEGLPNGEDAKWHVQLAETIAARNGSIDWQKVQYKIFIGILRVAYPHAGTVQAVVQTVIDLYERALNGEVITGGEWRAAARAAYAARAAHAADAAAYAAADAAAYAAAYSAADAAAAHAAYIAAAHAAYAAAYAAAAHAAAYAAAAHAAYREIRDVILAALS